MGRVELTDANIELKDLIERVEAGESIEITRDGRTVARLVATSPQRKPVDVEMLRQLAEAMPPSTGNAGDFIRWMRDTDRY